MGNSDVLVERIVSPDTGQDEPPIDYDIGQTIRPRDELVIETGSGPPEGFRNEIYRNEDIDIEEVIVEADVGDSVGGCVEAA